MANVEKLEAVLDYIRTHPEEHNQSTWAEKTACGTTLCFAGTAAALAGHQFVWDEFSNDAYLCRAQSGKVEYVAAVAVRELDLTDAQADALFIHSSTFDEVERTVKDIINEQTAG